MTRVTLAGGLVVLALLAIGSLLVPAADLIALARTDRALAASILVELRVPRMLLAVLYGGVLGASGAAVQALFGNPLASPDITGTSGGAALGAVVSAYLLGAATPFGFAIGGVAGAGAALGLLLLIAGPRADTPTLLLAGVAISTLAGAALALALALAPSPYAFYDALDWLMGSLVDRSLPQAGLATVGCAIAGALLAWTAPALDRLALGEEVAASLGHDLTRTRTAVIVATAIGVGACVSVGGAIGFIGLIAPVFARRLVAHHPGRAMLPAALIGAALLLAADLLVRLAPLGRTIPVGAITAAIGAPIFAWLIAGSRWRSTS